MAGFYSTSEAFARNLKRTTNQLDEDKENINPKWLCLEDKNEGSKVENKPDSHKSPGVSERNVSNGEHGENNTETKM